MVRSIASTTTSVTKGLDPDAPTKKCPQCEQDVAIQIRKCECGFVWLNDKVKHETKADEESQIISDPVHFVVQDTYASRHEKEGKTPSMRVNYNCLRNGEGNIGEVISEWICFEHQGLPRNKAIQWWHQHSAVEVPRDVETAVDWYRQGYCARPKSITAIKEGKWWRILERDIEEIPDPLSVIGVEEVPF